jgi:hypothetical protein
MEDVQDQEQEQGGTDSEQIMDSIGANGGSEESGDSEEQGNASKDDPYGIKKRLGMQAKKHQREMRAMRDQMAQLQSHYENSANPPMNESNPYNSPGQPNPPSGNEEERIQKAVRYALQAKDHEERQAKEAEGKAHIHKQYQRLNDEFDKASEKYDDFDDVVRGDDVPFTPHVRDALLLVNNPAEVAYNLGKNRSELERISKLHALDQAREVNNLSFALRAGNSAKGATTKSNPMGSLKANPTPSRSVNEKSSASDIRQRMKAGTWK